MSATAASPRTLPDCDIRSSSTAAATTTGTATASGATPSAEAIASAPKPTWLRPSPIIENLFNTRDAPSSAAHSDTSTPTTKARARKG